jgi:ABC-2 type transport system permease protein
MSELAELWRYREVLWNLVRRNLKVRYKNSMLGFLWSLLNPLMQIGVWWFLFKIILRNEEPNFMASLICGFIPWFFFSQTLMDSTGCVTQEMALVKKAYFPRALLPLAMLVSNLIHLGFAFVVLMGLFAVWRVDINLHYLWVVPCTLLIAMFAYGLSAMLAAWSVFYADVKFIVGNLLGLWFFLTPVVYSLGGLLDGQVTATNWLTGVLARWLPLIKRVYLLDPVAIGIVGYRSALLHGGANPIMRPEDLARQVELQAQYPFLHYAVGAAVIAIVFAVIGHLAFRRMSDLFAERG